MPHNLLRHVKKDLNKINQQSNQNIRNLRTNQQLNQTVKSLLETSSIDQILLQNTAQKISGVDLIKFSNNKGRVIRKNKLNDTYDYRCSNTELSPKYDSYDDSTKTFTSVEGVKYQVMDFDLKYETYIILTQENEPNRYILSPFKDVISLSFNKKVYDISENRFMLNLVFHQASEAVEGLELKFTIWKRDGVNPNVLDFNKTLESRKGLKNIDIVEELKEVYSRRGVGSYYFTVQNLNQLERPNVEILSNELKMENDSQTFIITNRMGGMGGMGGMGEIGDWALLGKNKSRNRKNKSRNRKNKSKNRKNKSKNRKNKSKNRKNKSKNRK